MSAEIKLIDEVWGDPNVDESGSNKRRIIGNLRLIHSQTTVRELISKRVRQEYSFKMTEAQPEAGKFLANSRDEIFSQMGKEKIEFGTQNSAVERALKAFEQGLVMFFWNGTQIMDIDARLDLMGENEAVFVQLVPLQGG